MINKTKIIAVLATLPIVVYATTLCCVENQISCWNVYPGVELQYVWTCVTGQGGVHSVSSPFTVADQPQKRWAQWINANGSAGYNAGTVNCIGNGLHVFGGYTCDTHWPLPGASTGPVTPTGTGAAEMNSWPDGTTCP